MIFLLFIPAVYAATFALFDEQAINTQCFTSDWKFHGASVQQGLCSSKTCGNRGTFVGPLDVQHYLDRTYSGLDAHFKAQIKMTFIKIDQFADDSLAINVGTTQYSITYGTNGVHSSISSGLQFSNELSSSECSAGGGIVTVAGEDAQIDVTLTQAHTESSLYVKLYVDWLSTSGAWGLRNYKLYLEVDCIVNCNRCSSPNVCTVCAYNRVNTPDCKCPLGTFDQGQPECATCIPGCNVCSNATSCTTCKTGRSGPSCACNDGTNEVNGECSSCPSKCGTCNAQGCITCSVNRSGPNCDCVDGYFESSGTCQKCSYKCTRCNASGCIGCSDAARSPAPSCSCPTYEIAAQTTCPTCNSLCQTCNASGCLTCKDQNRTGSNCGCVDKYFEDNGKCLACSSICATCNVNGCLTCLNSSKIAPKCECPTGQTEINGVCRTQSNIFAGVGTFSDDLQSVIITFADDVALDAGLFGSTPSISNCEAIKEFTDGLCYVNGKQFIIELSEKHQLTIGTVIVFSGSLKVLGQPQAVLSDVILTGPPNNVQFQVNYQSTVVQCKKSTISISDIIGTGNKQPIIRYNAIPTIDQLGSGTSITLTNLSASSYSISITVTNFLQQSTTQTIQIKVTGEATPVIDMQEMIGQMFSYMTLNFEATIKLDTCIEIQSPIITTQWVLDGVAGTSVTATPMVSNKFMPNTFSPKSTHNLTLVATYQNTQAYSTTLFTIDPAPLLVTIVGGSRMVSVARQIKIEGIIVDTDNVGYTYSWLCTVTSTGAPCPIKFNQTLTQIIPANTLQASTGYTIMLTAGSVKSQINLLVQDNLDQEIQLKYAAKYNTQTVNLNEKLVFIVQIVNGDTVYKLSSSSVLKYNIIEGGVIKASRTSSTSVVSFSLDEFGVTKDTTIQFIFDTLVAFTTVKVNQSPTNGVLVCTNSGQPVDTLFDMQITGALDANVPLQYKFSALVGNMEILLTDWQSTDQFTTQLPQGNLATDYSVIIVGEVSDSKGAITKLTKQIKVAPSSRRLLQGGSVKDITTKLEAALASGSDISIYAYQYKQMQEGGCLKLCSNHGTCTNSACKCDSGYYLDDCSANKTEYDTIVQLLNQVLDQLKSQQTTEMTQASRDQLARAISITLARKELVNSMSQTQVSSSFSSTTTQLNGLFGDYSITKGDSDELTKQLPDPQRNRRQQQVNSNVQSQTGVVDQLFSATEYTSSSKYQDPKVQDSLNKQLMNTTRSVSSFYADQLYTDQDATIQEGTNIYVKAQRLTDGQSIKYFPYANYLFETLTDDELMSLNEVGMGEDVEMSAITMNTNPYCADPDFPYQNQTNQMVAANFKDSQGNPTKPRRQLSYQLKAQSGNTCVTQKDGKWSNSGCAELNDLISGDPQCSCDSITEITIIDDVASMFENSNLGALANPNALINFAFWESALFYMSVVLTGSWVICMVVGWRKDLREFQEFKAVAEKEKQETALQVEYDSDEEYQKTKLKLQENRKLAKEFIYGFPMLHQFVSIFTVFSDEEPRPARFTIYFMKMIIMMALTSIFGQNLTITQSVVFAVIAVALMAPMTAILLKGFAYDANLVKKCVSVFLIIIIFGGCFYVCLVVAATLGVTESNDWAITYVASLVVDIIIMETMTIFLKLLLIPYIKAHIHSGNLIIRLMYLYLFEKNVDRILLAVI